MPDDPLVGFDAAGLRFEALLGRGAMGAVYKGVQVGLNRSVAIKVIAPHLAEDQTYLDRFLREGRTLGRLKHPHVIACHDIIHTKGPNGGDLVLMALEYVDGWSLGALLKKKHRLTARQVIELHRQAAEGLSAAHQLGIIHRDVKPDNIMVTRNGQAKLADFGLAKGEESAMLTQTGAIMGSPSYMAPEACMGEVPTASADCYSLGCSLYHALTGVTPFQANSAVQALHQHVHAPIPRLSARRPDLKSLDPLLIRMLAKKPQDRFTSAAELGAALKAAQTTIPTDAPAGVSTAEPTTSTDPTVEAHHPTQTLVPATSTPITLPTPTSTPPTIKRRRWPWAVASVVVLLLALIAARQQEPRPARDQNTPSTRGDAVLTANLDNIDALLDKGQITAAEVVLNQLPITGLPTSGPLAERLARAHERVKAPAPVPVPAGDPKVDHLEEAEKLLASGQVDEADRLARAAPQTTEQAGRRFGLLRRITQEYEERIKDVEHQLASSELLLKNGQVSEARQQLETLVLPRTASESLRARHRQLLTQSKAGSASELTHLRVGPQGFDGKELPVGAANLPFYIPAGINWVAYGTDGVLTLRLPQDASTNASKSKKSGVVALIAASESATVRVTLLIGGKRIPHSVAELPAELWTPVPVPLASNDPVTGIEFAVSDSARKVRLYGAGAVHHATRAATVSDLALVPGGLRPLPMPFGKRDPAQSFSALANRLAANNPGFVKLDRALFAVPNDSPQSAGKVITGLARFMERTSATSSTTEDLRIVNYTSAESLDAACHQALINKAHLLVVVVNTTNSPTLTTVPTHVQRYRKAMEKGTLPVLMLTHHYDQSEALRRSWELYVAALIRELPTLPIIDGGVAPRFQRVHADTLAPDAAQRLRDDSVLAGFGELLARLRAILVISGVGR